MSTDSLIDLTLLRERIKCQRDSRYDNQFIELLDILIHRLSASVKTLETPPVNETSIGYKTKKPIVSAGVCSEIPVVVDDSPMDYDCHQLFKAWVSTQGGNIDSANYEAWKAGYRNAMKPVSVSLKIGATAMHNYAYTNDLSERDGFIQEEYLDNAKACAKAWGLSYVD